MLERISLPSGIHYRIKTAGIVGPAVLLCVYSLIRLRSISFSWVTVITILIGIRYELIETLIVFYFFSKSTPISVLKIVIV